MSYSRWLLNYSVRYPEEASRQSERNLERRSDKRAIGKPGQAGFDNVVRMKPNDDGAASEPELAEERAA